MFKLMNFASKARKTRPLIHQQQLAIYLASFFQHLSSPMTPHLQNPFLHKPPHTTPQVKNHKPSSNISQTPPTPFLERDKLLCPETASQEKRREKTRQHISQPTTDSQEVRKHNPSTGWWRPGRDLNPELVAWNTPHNVDRATAEHTRPDYTTRATGTALQEKSTPT